MEPRWVVQIKLDKSALDPALGAIMPDFFNVSAPDCRQAFELTKIEQQLADIKINEKPSKK